MKTPNNSQGTSFLPDFCNIRIVIAIIIIAEMLAIILTLAAPEGWQDGWLRLSIISLYIQWIALSGTALLCALRRQLNRFSDSIAALASYGLLLLTTLCFAEIVYWLSQIMPLALVQIEDDHSEFLGRNLAISAIASLIVVRYFLLRHQLMRNIEAENQSRLQALHARIRPHFLFNSLNTIASLIHIDAHRAEEAVEDLSDLFRHNLSEARPSAPFHQELEVAQRYINMEKLRLGERLHVDWQLGSVPANATLPSLALQPLLENAIYHGIENLPDGGTILCKGELHRKTITLTISNPVTSNHIASHREGHSIAIDNLRQRIKAHFQNHGHLSINNQDGTFTVKLTLPYQAYTEQ